MKLKLLAGAAFLCLSGLSHSAPLEYRNYVPGLQVTASAPSVVTTPGIPAAIGRLSPTSLNFGPVHVGQTKSLSTTLSNTGSAPLARREIVVSAGFSLESTNCPTTLNPGATCQITVKFTPTGTAEVTGSLTVTTDSVSQLAPVALRGQGNVHTIITQPNGTRVWSDGTTARSCNEYLNPPVGYAYTGATGDGFYKVDADGPRGNQFIDAFCDMTTYGGGWTRVVLQYENAPLLPWETSGINGASRLV